MKKQRERWKSRDKEEYVGQKKDEKQKKGLRLGKKKKNMRGIQSTVTLKITAVLHLPPKNNSEVVFI